MGRGLGGGLRRLMVLREPCYEKKQIKRKKEDGANFFCAFCGKYEYFEKSIRLRPSKMNKAVVMKIRKTRIKW